MKKEYGRENYRFRQAAVILFTKQKVYCQISVLTV